ncbi:hypothetical protein ABW20_dc0106750 [Dactylellina cionopaga]|nr:hypothetical protein ABW20_dc0106750 [Dactylellina cionopaga]
MRSEDDAPTFLPDNMSPAVLGLFLNLGVNCGVSITSDLFRGLCNSVTTVDKEITVGRLAINIFNSVSEASWAPLVSRAGGGIIIRDLQIMVVYDLFSISPYRSSVVNSPHDSRTSASQSGIWDDEIKSNNGVNKMDIEIEEKTIDMDEENLRPPKRPTILTHSVVVTMGMMAVIIITLASIGQLVGESMWDREFKRLALLVTLLPGVPLASFFFLVTIGNLCQAFGPLTDVSSNSRKFSSHKPKRFRHRNLELPHITIQMPVYKEGLKGVIKPTVTSLLAAVKEYEREGGTASIYINDDGLQVIPPDIADQRVEFYTEHGIGYCSRPAHGKNGFVRKGKFKKASNMNYGLYTSILVEDKLAEIKTAKMEGLGITDEEQITLEQEDEWYNDALEIVVKQSEGRTIAAGNIRIGEIILIVDCDTKVPLDCLVMAAMEMAESPEVAIIQHASGVMQVVWNKFENAITYFTNLVYDAIVFSVGQGDNAPFVGHNAFLRWKAVQAVAFEEDGVTKFWSESHVSEDFDMALRLQTQGFVIRMATYHHGEFKEGVSLTVFDELTRWEKYAYGCSELVFHPLHQWFTKGIFTPLFKTFIFSNIIITSKITMLAYISTYYALGFALPLSILNYFIYGWCHGTSWLDEFYQESWKVFLPLVVIFNLLSPLAYSIMRHRLKIKRFDKALLESIRWSPTFILFFGGISWHLFVALFSHIFNVNMEWGSTAKEVAAGGYYVGVDRIIKGFKWMYIILLPFCGGMVYLGVWAPYGWLITQPTTVVPLAVQLGCHALMPIFLGFDLL